MTKTIGGQRLRIANVDREDSGKYTCLARNDAGQDTVDFNLEVLGE